MATPGSEQLCQRSIFDYIRSVDGDVNPSQQHSPAVTRSKAANIPERSADHMSNKQRKSQHKRQRKARRSTQNVSRNLSGSSTNTDSSPPPSPSLDSSRTFSQMLNDALPTQSVDSSVTQSVGDTLLDELKIYKERVTHLEKANTSLKVERDLLNDDLTSATKLLDQFKKNTKKITAENDKLKRDISKKSGTRKFTTSTAGTQTQSDIPTTLRDATDMSVAKFNSFCDHISTIAKSLLDDFSSAKLTSPPTQTEPAVHSSASSTEGFQPVRPHKRSVPRNSSAPVSSATQSNPIPVIGASPPTYADVTSRTKNTASNPTQRRPGQGSRRRNKTIILGTSLTDGLSSELNKHGISSTTHIYRGAHLDLIRERVPHIFSKDVSKQPDKILLLGGGNDAEESSVDRTINSYDGLVRDIRKLCPQSKIIISAIPPRKDSNIINKRIKEVNEYLYDRGQRNDFVEFVDVVPTESNLFTKKKVHFNSEGKSIFASRLKPFLLD